MPQSKKNTLSKDRKAHAYVGVKPAKPRMMSAITLVFGVAALLACAGSPDNSTSQSSQNRVPAREVAPSPPDIQDCWSDCDDAWGNGCNDLYGAACEAKERDWKRCKNNCCSRADPDSIGMSEDAFCRGGF